MKANDIDVVDFLISQRTYTIPVYQRNYDWKEDNCKKLLDDILKAEKDESPEYFLGSFVIVKKEAHEFFIIDGQQRLTTITLLLLAIYNNNSEIAKGHQAFIKRLIFSNIQESDKRLILKQIQKDDAFLSKIINKEFTHNDNSNIINNYSFFSNYINTNSQIISDIMNGLNRLRVVQITLTKDDQPQLVFETLNATGKKLSEADKIRNYILMYKDQEKLYHNYWSKIEENCLQHVDSNSVSNFMKAFLTIEFGITKPIKDDMVYEEFKRYLENKKNEEVLWLMLEYSKCYNIILTKKHLTNLNITRTIFHINELEITVLNPLILCILKLEMDNKISTDKAAHMIGILENYLARRIICRVPSNALNKVVVSLINKLNVKNSEESIIKVFEEYLFSIGASSRFPKDEEVKESLITRELYGRYGKFLLSLIESINSKEKNSLENISIEHIMPQKLSKKWQEYLGENYKEIYDTYIHTLGNLTLTGYNPELSNKPMKDKQSLLADSKFRYLNEEFKNDSIVKFRYLNEEFKNDGIVWNKEEILKRTNRLTEAILRIYPALNVEIDTSKIEDDILEYELDSDENFTNSHIIKYEYKDNIYEVSDKLWSTFIVQICGHIYEHHPVEFHQYIIENTDFENKVSYENKFKYNKTLTVVGRALYFNTENDTNSKINFLVKVFETLKLDTDDVSLFIRLEK